VNYHSVSPSYAIKSRTINGLTSKVELSNQQPRQLVQPNKQTPFRKSARFHRDSHHKKIPPSISPTQYNPGTSAPVVSDITAVVSGFTAKPLRRKGRTRSNSHSQTSLIPIPRPERVAPDSVNSFDSPRFPGIRTWIRVPRDTVIPGLNTYTRLSLRTRRATRYVVSRRWYTVCAPMFVASQPRPR
jgi:hypothetical protein